jgi:hypothetical protein
MRRLSRICIAFALVLGLLAVHVAATRQRHGESQGEGQADTRCRIAGPAIELAQLRESSGLAASRRAPNVLWSHNDSGEPVVYAIASDGAIKGRVRIAGADLKDWEDVAVGPCPAGFCLYIADIGDNHASRSSITVYRVPEPAPGDEISSPAETFHATYPDGPRDAEGLFVLPSGALHGEAVGSDQRAAADRGRDPAVTDNVFIVTKDEPVAVYRFPQPLRAGATVRLERVAALGDPGGRVTAAGASPDGGWIVARTHRAVIFYRTEELLAGKVREAMRFDLTALREPQGEGVALVSNGSVYLSGEGGRGGTLARVSCRMPR